MNWESFRQLGCAVIPSAKIGDYTTFRIGGPCLCLVDCSTSVQLESAVRLLCAQGLPFTLIGGGSNLLVSDTGLDSAVIRYYSEKCQIRRDGVLLEVDAGMLLDDLALYAVEEGLSGLVYTSGIPGTVGGAVVGNAGAFGKQIGDIVEAVQLIDHHGFSRWVPAGDLSFNYRTSRLQNNGEIVVAVRLHLFPGGSGALKKERDDILALRRDKHPDWKQTPTAGSFFKNIQPTSAAERRQAAGWYLEQVGAKEMRVGGARVFEKHANIIVADPGCRSQDVLNLSCKMAAAVKEKFNLELEREVRLLGNFV